MDSALPASDFGGQTRSNRGHAELGATLTVASPPNFGAAKA
jgi:hypothetical protein